MKNISFIVFCFSLIVKSYAAGDLKAPIGLSSARILPVNIRNFSEKTVFVTASERYNSNGQTKVLADPFFKDITYGELIKGKTDSKDKAAIELKMLEVGADPNTKFAETIGQVNVSAVANVPVFAIGTKIPRWTLAVAVPVINSSVNVDTAVRHTNPENMKKMSKAIRDSDALKAAEFDHKMQDPINSKLSEYGYKPLRSDNSSKLGDVRIISKYNVTDDAKKLVTLTQAITLPTGMRADVDKAVDVAGGDGQWDLSAGVAVDYRVKDRVDLLWMAEYTVQMQDELAVRVPERSDSTLSPDVDKNAKRDLGDIWATGAGIKYTFENSVNIGTQYTYQYKSRDSFSGNDFKARRYEWLEQNTQQEMHLMQVNLGYDTVALFRQKKFPVPLVMGVQFAKPVAGRNVVSDSSIMLDVGLFF